MSNVVKPQQLLIRLLNLLRSGMLLLALQLPLVATAAPTSFDTTFGTGGKFTFSVSPSTDIPYSSALQPDGKIVVAGFCFYSFYSVCVSRINANGTLDNTFGTGGTYVGTVGVNTTNNAQVVVLADGKILFGAHCRSGGQDDFCLLRLTASGTLDGTFGTSGVVNTDFAGLNDVIYGLYAVPGGRIVAAGRCDLGAGFRFCIARYQSNGALDTTFGSSLNGRVTLSLSPTGASRARGLAIQADGKLLLHGACDYNAVTELCMARFSANGALDSTFGTSGIVHTTAFGGSFTGNGAAFQADGKLVVAGTCAADFCVARFLENGAIDSTFGASGFSRVNFGPGTTIDYAGFVNVQSDGKIIVDGVCQISATFENCLLRLNTDGSLDLSFSATGKFNFVDDPRGGGGGGTLIQSDGKLVLLSQCGGGSDNNICLARLEGGPQSGRAGATRQMVEYSYAPLDYYFITSRDSDKALLDVGAGWSRTGKSFSVLANNDVDSRPITRFYFDQIAKNKSRGSHFYTLLPEEVAAVQALNPTNQPAPGKPVNEGVDSYAYLPSASGTCSSGQVRVYRLFRGNARFPDDPNHRFTTELSTYNSFVTAGWDGEGVKFCVPQ